MNIVMKILPRTINHGFRIDSAEDAEPNNESGHIEEYDDRVLDRSQKLF